MIKFFIGVILFCAALWAVLITVGILVGVGSKVSSTHYIQPARR